MSELIGSKNAVLPFIDPRLASVLTVLTQCDIPEKIRNDFTLVTFAVAKQLEKEGRVIESGLPINCLFLSGNEFSIRLDLSQLAVCMKMAVYPIHSLMSAPRQEVRMTLIAEELCHLIWEISDEEQINYKVLTVLRNIDPTITLERIGYRS